MRAGTRDTTARLERRRVERRQTETPGIFGAIVGLRHAGDTSRRPAAAHRPSVRTTGGDTSSSVSCPERRVAERRHQVR